MMVHSRRAVNPSPIFYDETDCKGWDGSTVFVLCSGQVWQRGVRLHVPLRLPSRRAHLSIADRSNSDEGRLSRRHDGRQAAPVSRGRFGLGALYETAISYSALASWRSPSLLSIG